MRTVNIPTRAKLIMRAVCDAYGCTKDDLVSGMTRGVAPMARKSAILLFEEHLPFMGKGYAREQLQYKNRGEQFSKKENAVDADQHERARRIYSALMREARHDHRNSP